MLLSIPIRSDHPGQPPGYTDGARETGTGAAQPRPYSKPGRAWARSFLLSTYTSSSFVLCLPRFPSLAVPATWQGRSLVGGGAPEGVRGAQVSALGRPGWIEFLSRTENRPRKNLVKHWATCFSSAKADLRPEQLFNPLLIWLSGVAEGSA